MKNEKIIKAFSIILMTLIIINTISNVALAAVTGMPDPGTLSGKNVDGVTGITSIGNQIITLVSTIGSVVSVVVLVILGLKYMMGSAEEKAEYKKTLMPYIIGAGLVFAASAIAGIIFGFTQNLGQ